MSHTKHEIFLSHIRFSSFKFDSILECFHNNSKLWGIIPYYLLVNRRYQIVSNSIVSPTIDYVSHCSMTMFRRVMLLL